MTRGKLITLEGADGSGKTTMLSHIVEQCSAHGLNVIKTREPGGSNVAEEIRSLLLSTTYEIDKDAELLLFLAARCHHIRHTIEPALNAGSWVICDRFTDSSLAYQSESVEDMWIKREWMLNSFDWLLVPDYTLYFCVSRDTALARMSLRNGDEENNDRIERTLINRIDKMIQIYNKLSIICPHYIKIDANANEESVRSQLSEALSNIINLTSIKN